jgi:hypothetical protein
MEDTGILDVNNDLHIFCLHFVFIPQIRQHLSHFASGWNHHGLSSEGRKTPLQMWIRGMFEGNGHRASREFWESVSKVLVGLYIFNL